VHLGPGPNVDEVHARSLRASLLTGESLEPTDPGESEDVGVDWGDPRALSCFGLREPTEPWSWHGPPRSVTGHSWGGCLEVIEWMLTAGRFPFDPAVRTVSRPHRRHRLARPTSSRLNRKPQTPGSHASRPQLNRDRELPPYVNLPGRRRHEATATHAATGVVWTTVAVITAR
jgi:hypothetical protein